MPSSSILAGDTPGPTMKIKNVIASLLCALTGSLTLASPLVFQKGGLEGPFSQQFSFTVDGEQQYVGSVNTKSRDQDNLLISSIELSNGSVSYVFDGTDDLDRFASVQSSIAETGKDDKKIHWYLRSYELSPFTLAAGQWQLTVNGYDGTGDKSGNIFSVSLDAANNVPEPQSLALMLAAGAALVVASRRRRAAR
jgi:hypothetical protein